MLLAHRSPQCLFLLVAALLAGAPMARAQSASSGPDPEAAVSETPSAVINQQQKLMHPALFSTPEVIQAAVTRGREFAEKGKKLDDLLKPYRVQPRWTRGKGGGANTTVYCYTLDGMAAAVLSFNAARLYTTPEIPDDVLKKGGAPKAMAFCVLMRSTPKKAKWRWQHDRAADAREVTVEKFVLTDDKGSIWESSRDISEGLKTGTQTFTGVSTMPRVTNSRTSGSASGSAWGNDGSYVYGSAQGTSTTSSTTYSFVPWSESHPYYECSYMVEFPLRDSDGVPLIGPDVKELKLHMITPVGEQTATYKLPKPKISSK